MKEKMYFSLPIEIEDIESKLVFSDDTLIPVDLKIMHDGLNLNESTFYEEAIESAKPSLSNKPILGYIKNGEGDDSSDFAGHEVEILMTEDGFKQNYLERPLGVIPEQNSYSIMQDDNGKNYVFCRGYLWREYLNSGYEILKNNPNKSISMEIVVDDYSFNEDDTINITKYRYLGVTILGDDVMPGMEGAKMNVVGQFTKVNDSSLCEKIEDLNKKIESHFSLDKGGFEGGEKVDKQEITKSEEVEVVKVEDVEEIVEDEKFEEEEIAEDDSVAIAEESVVNAEDTKEQSDVDSARILVNKLEDGEDKDALLSRLDAIQVDSETDTDTDIEDSEEDYELKYTELLDKFNTLEEEMVELKEFKDLRLQEDFELEQAEIKAEKVKYINDNYADLKEDVKEMFIGKVDEYESVEDIDADICVYIVKNKLSFAKSKKEVDSVKIGITEDSKNRTMSPYGALFSKRI